MYAAIDDLQLLPPEHLFDLLPLLLLNMFISHVQFAAYSPLRSLSSRTGAHSLFSLLSSNV